MKIVKRIFLDDVVGLIKNFFALVIVLGICFLPALYAWFNIYSNWDPYGNTGALKFAAVSLDEGYTDEDGEYHNQGDTIIENLHENTAVDWQFVENANDAVDGVYSGEYYAAVVVDKDFTYNMYNVLTEEVDRPVLHFYENQKKNPVATKISDTVVQTLQNNINVAFTEVVVSRVFSSASDVSQDIENEGGVDEVLEKLRELSSDLTTYQNALTKIIENDAQLKEALEVAETDVNNIKNQTKSSADAIKNSKTVSDTAKTTLNGYTDDVNSMLSLISNEIDSIDSDITKAMEATSVEEIADNIENSVIKLVQVKDYISKLTIKEVLKNELLAHIESLENNLREYGLGRILDIAKRGIEAKQTVEEIKKEIKREVAIEIVDELKPQYKIGEDIVKTEEDLKAIAGYSKEKIDVIKELYNSKVAQNVDETLGELSNTLDNANKLLNSLSDTFGNLSTMFVAIGNTVEAADTSIEKTNEAIVYVNGRVIEVINETEKAGTNEKLQVLVNALAGDPTLYGKFFSTPVEVTTEAVYPIENYGSAVAPFYSTLAFWVGALILTAIIKVKPDKSKYPGASQRQLYFGRYALYWVLGQIQAVIIVAGDILLLKIQCIHPWLFVLAGSVIATTFTLLIYSLVVTWGDAGKALAVVLVVIQIAGSSGTYPIELLPDFFKKVYIFFPFPYGINAIRECLCGTYKLDYLKYLGTLIIFMIVSLVIGLLIRIPFESINHYMEERMEDTEMM